MLRCSRWREMAALILTFGYIYHGRREKAYKPIIHQLSDIPASNMKSVAALVIVLELSAAVLAQTTTRTSTFVTSTNPSTPTSGGPSNQTSGGPSSLPSCSEPGFGESDRQRSLRRKSRR